MKKKLQALLMLTFLDSKHQDQLNSGFLDSIIQIILMVLYLVRTNGRVKFKPRIRGISQNTFKMLMLFVFWFWIVLDWTQINTFMLVPLNCIELESFQTQVHPLKPNFEPDQKTGCNPTLMLNKKAKYNILSWRFATAYFFYPIRTYEGTQICVRRGRLCFIAMCCKK